MFMPIRTAAALPATGRTNERFYLDFKAEPTADAFENAKDVAAFANGDGGTILIGAKGSGEFLASYEPLTTKAASDAQRAIDTAVRDRCAPVPLFDVTSIEVEAGRFVVAVNIWPFPGQVVGVELKKGEAKCGAKQNEPQGVYFFPRRVGAQMTSIRPEQIPMFMDARVRRNTTLLRSIPDAGRANVYVAQSEPSTSTPGNSDLLDINEYENSVRFRRNDNGRTGEYAVALDAIERVWKRPNGTWQIQIQGGPTWG